MLLSLALRAARMQGTRSAAWTVPPRSVFSDGNSVGPTAKPEVDCASVTAARHAGASYAQETAGRLRSEAGSNPEPGMREALRAASASARSISLEVYWLRAAGDPTVLHAYVRDGRADWWQHSTCGGGPGAGTNASDDNFRAAPTASPPILTLLWDRVEQRAHWDVDRRRRKRSWRSSHQPPWQFTRDQCGWITRDSKMS
jgi:hypothetical protein